MEEDFVIHINRLHKAVALLEAADKARLHAESRQQLDVYSSPAANLIHSLTLADVERYLVTVTQVSVLDLQFNSVQSDTETRTMLERGK